MAFYVLLVHDSYAQLALYLYFTISSSSPKNVFLSACCVTACVFKSCSHIIFPLPDLRL